jgi:tape measure domain-containing protein
VADETIDVLIRARGGRQAASEARAVEQAFAGIGKTVGSTRVVIDENTSATERSSSAFMTAARTAGAFAVSMGALRALRSGIDFVSTMQQNQIAFEQFLGSAAAARQEITALRALGNEIPQFGFDTFATNAKKLLAMGTPLQRVNKDLKIMAETAQGLGLGAEGVDRITLAIGQMRSTGVVQGDELRQLMEAGIRVYPYLIQAGVIAQKDIGKIGQMHIDAATAIDAIMNGMASDFGGLSEKAKNTWASQFGALKNNAAAAAGAFVKPLMDLAGSSVLPAMTRFFQAMSSGGADQVWQGLTVFIQGFGPAIALLTAYRTAILLVTAAQWAWNLAMNANPIGLVITGIGLLIGGIILLVKHWDAVKAAVVSVFDWVMAHPWAAILIGPLGMLIVVAGGVIKYWNQIKATVVGVWQTIRPILMTMYNILSKIVEWSPLGVAHRIGRMAGLPGIPFMAGGGTIPVGGMAVVGDAGPEVARNTGHGTEITPMTGGSGGAPRTLQPVQFAVDGRVFAEVVLDIGSTAAARA